MNSHLHGNRPSWPAEHMLPQVKQYNSSAVDYSCRHYKRYEGVK